VLVLACDPIRFSALAGWRIIADPAALDAAPWPVSSEPDGAHVVRISPDDVFLIGGAQPSIPGDPNAIVTPEHGFSGASLSADEVARIGLHHIEWAVPPARPALAQGQVAGVPAKLVLHADGSALLLVACAAQHELEDRLNGVQA
jgi:hypothetical protein